MPSDLGRFGAWLRKPFRHRHSYPYRELYMPWEGPAEWVRRCRCGHEERELVDG